jgi:hypothetical protein
LKTLMLPDSFITYTHYKYTNTQTHDTQQTRQSLRWT